MAGGSLISARVDPLLDCPGSLRDDTDTNIDKNTDGRWISDQYKVDPLDH